MALTDSQKISAAYKALMGVAETSTARDFFEEPFKTSIVVTPDMIWQDAYLIPATAPDIPVYSEEIDGEMIDFGTDGVLAYYNWLSLRSVPGTAGSFYHPLLKNAITFNWDAAGSYVYRLRNQADFDIAFGSRDWVVDPIAGVLTFYGTNLGGIGVSSNNPPKISFYRYIGRVGFPSGEGGGGGDVDLPLPDTETLLYRLGAANQMARFAVRGGTGTKVYELPPIDGDQDTGRVLVEENLNTAINTFGVVDGGEWT